MSCTVALVLLLVLLHNKNIQKKKKQKKKTKASVVSTLPLLLGFNSPKLAPLCISAHQSQWKTCITRSNDIKLFRIFYKLRYNLTDETLLSNHTEHARISLNIQSHSNFYFLQLNTFDIIEWDQIPPNKICKNEVIANHIP